jgi:hypothetical protein
MRPRWLVLTLLALPGCNSTGVGNPAPVKLQLSITRDDELAETVGDDGNSAGIPTIDEAAAGAGSGGAAGGEASPAGAAGAAGAADVTSAAGAPSATQPLPRAAVHNAILVVGELRFLACDQSHDADSVAVGPFLVDLLQGGTSPAIPEVSVPPSGFCGLDAPLAPAQAPARLVGRSVYFDGVRADGTAFRVYANLQATLRVRARAGVSWNPRPEQKRSVFWALRPRRWLEPGELNALNAADDDGSGNLLIDLERHPLLVRAIRSRLAGSSTLYDDLNADDVFDTGDRDAVIGDGLPDAD